MNTTGDTGPGPGSGESLPAPGPLPVLALLTVWLLALALVPGCAPPGDDDDGLTVVARLDPATPAVGDAALELRLIDGAGQPVPGATVRVEANMNHAGMVPTFADLTEDAQRPGVYGGTLSFTMGGDWYLQVDAELADGTSVTRIVDVPGVRSR